MNGEDVNKKSVFDYLKKFKIVFYVLATIIFSGLIDLLFTEIGLLYTDYYLSLGISFIIIIFIALIIDLIIFLKKYPRKTTLEECVNIINKIGEKFIIPSKTTSINMFAIDDVEKSLGKPSTTSTQDVQGVQVKDYIWDKGGVSISVQFNDDKTVSKDITGFKFSRTPKFDLDAYNNLADGSSYDDVVSKYGEPDGLNEMIISGEKNVTATWITGTKGGSIGLTFTNDSLTSKTQSDLK